MISTKTFVRKHKKQLPLKYFKRTVTSLLNRDVSATDEEALEAIQDEFNRFIEIPLK